MNQTPQWAIPMEPVSEDQILKTYTADVVVLGAGYSGTAAARAAAEADAHVLVVEQQNEKNFSCFGAQYGSVNSEFMKKRGAPEVDPVDIIADWQRRSLNRANPALIRQFAYNTGSTFDWYIDPLPEEMKDVMTFMNPWPKHFQGELNGFNNYVGTAIFKNSKFDMSKMGPPPGMEEEGGPGGPPPQEGKDGQPPKMPGNPLSMTESIQFTHGLIRGMGGEFLFGITGEYLEKDETGRVVALIGRNYKKEYFRFKANNGVILAAGDFSGNKAMVMDLLNEYAALTENGEKFPYSPAGRKGKGIQMGLWAGGKMEPGPRGGMWCCVGGSGGPMDGSAFLRLNKHGKRYTNEGIMGYWGAGLQGARQPKGAIYTVWDSNWREELEYQTLDHTAVEPSSADMIEHQLKRAQREGIDNSFRPQGPPGSNKGLYNSLACADTIEGLADNLGLTGTDKENFIASVARYNELAHKGKDEDFAKDPRQLHPIEKAPFYAFAENVRQVGFLMVTVCGLVVDEHQQVIAKADDEPIPGLYATGNCSGERFPILYTTPVAGVSIGIAITLGRIVGDYVARNK